MAVWDIIQFQIRIHSFANALWGAVQVHAMQVNESQLDVFCPSQATLQKECWFQMSWQHAGEVVSIVVVSIGT